MDNQTLQESKEALVLLRSFPDGEISVENRALLDEKLSANTHRLKTEDKDHGLTGVPTTDLQDAAKTDHGSVGTDAVGQGVNVGQAEVVTEKEPVKEDVKEEVKESAKEEGKQIKKAGKEKPTK